VGAAVICIRDLEFRYREGEFALRIPVLDVERGSSVAFVGPSGSGKTTLLHLIAGIAVPLAGSVEASGVEVSALPDGARRDFRIRHLGLIFQEFELLEYLSVLDNMLLPYRINPSLALDGAVRRRAVELAEQVGIRDKLARFPGRLSQGERQRVAVCRAVLPQPALILADEPTGNLDPDNTGLVLDLLFELAGRSEATLLTVTHDRDLLPRFDRIVDFKAFHHRAPAAAVAGEAHRR
jgi:putative ABC transport system ATP-binding protein